MKTLETHLTIVSPKSKDSQWMNTKSSIIGDKPSKLMAIKGANMLLKSAGIDFRLDELHFSRE